MLRNIKFYVVRREGTRSLNRELRVRVAKLASLTKNESKFFAVPSISMRTDNVDIE